MALHFFMQNYQKQVFEMQIIRFETKAKLLDSDKISLKTKYKLTKTQKRSMLKAHQATRFPAGKLKMKAANGIWI